MFDRRALYSQVHDLPEVDYTDEGLLLPDLDLVLQEGVDAIPYEGFMEHFLQKWEGLVEKWYAAWRELQVGEVLVPCRCSSRVHAHAQGVTTVVAATMSAQAASTKGSPAANLSLTAAAQQIHLTGLLLPPMPPTRLHTMQQHAASMGGSSKAAHRAHQAGKWELRRSIVAELQAELLTGAAGAQLPASDQFAAAAQVAAATMLGSPCGAISSSTVTNVFTTPFILVNASACYQAAYR